MTVKTELKPVRKIQAKIVSLSVGLNTIKVEVERLKAHPKYNKSMKMHKHALVNVLEANKASLSIGQTVAITSTRPVSKLKRWKLA